MTGVCVFEDFISSDLAAQIVIEGKKFSYNYSHTIRVSMHSGLHNLKICTDGLMVKVDDTMKDSNPMRALMEMFMLLVDNIAEIHTRTEKKTVLLSKAGAR